MGIWGDFGFGIGSQGWGENGNLGGIGIWDEESGMGEEGGHLGVERMGIWGGLDGEMGSGVENQGWGRGWEFGEGKGGIWGGIGWRNGMWGLGMGNRGWREKMGI